MKDETQRGEVNWQDVIRNRISPLCHERGERWPLIFWKSGGYTPLAREEVNMMLARGIIQHIPMTIEMIPTAKALQEHGAPVIIMENKMGEGPYALGEEHLGPPQLPQLNQFDGWAKQAEVIRQTLRRFKQAGVRVDAAWLDWETLPLLASYKGYKQHGLLPKSIKSAKRFRYYRRQLWNQLMSAYVAAPIREVFPDISVSNWIINLSTERAPVKDWLGRSHPLLAATLFTATTPVAYAIDTAFLAQGPNVGELTQGEIDRFYMHVMLRQVSADSYNRHRYASYLKAIPWVARWVPDHLSKKAPIMSRTHYREALRHLWLRGIDGMQVYNVVASPYQEMAIAEMEDAQQVYDEMLAFKQTLQNGQVMNYTIPAADHDGTLWSGVSLDNRAIIRVVSQSDEVGSIQLKLWKKHVISLTAPPEGATYDVRLISGEVVFNKVVYHACEY
uniref:Uncharacterized protein n=1 Tax=Magnetococcus massalia (strain MO-1) TaxID=451514 RepID=A0A1S7LJF6_MAGMO|nr:Protein of unknown function [Candidatus Magnetococcus massalia]